MTHAEELLAEGKQRAEQGAKTRQNSRTARYVCHIHVDQFPPDILDFSEHISCNCTICLSLATGARRPQDQSG